MTTEESEMRAQHEPEETQHALEMIAKQATTGTALTPTPGGWVRALPHLDGVACAFQPEDSLTTAHVWYDDGDYWASGLPPGLEDREGEPLSEHAAAALLEGGVMHEPVDVEEIDDAR